MSEPILTVLKFFLLALIWLFFIRVLRVQWVDIRTRQVAPAPVPSVPARSRSNRGAVPAAPAGVPAGAAAVAAVAARAPRAPAGPTAGSAEPDRAPSAPAGSTSGSGAGADAGAGAGAGAGSVAAGYVLRAIDGPDHPARPFPVSGEMTVGRSSGADIALAGDSFVSSRHARIWSDGGALWIEDLGSTNGTTVNGRTVSARTRLGPGDQVQVGRTILEVAAA